MEGSQVIFFFGEGDDFAINAGLAYGPGDQLGVLRAEIKDNYFFRHQAVKVVN